MAIRNIFYKDNEFDISYVFQNNHSQKNIVFLHGWGSNKELMQLAFKDTFKDYNHFYIDLPGFGNSPNDIIISTFDYSKIIDLFFESLDVSVDIIVGHSFGGKIALLCKCDEIILLGSAGIPTPKPLKIKIKILLAKILKNLKIKSRVLASADANNLNDAMYEVFKQVVNEDFSDIYARYDKKATIFWGADDKATPLSSGYKISTLLKNSRFFIFEGDHYFFLKQGRVIDKKYHYEGKSLNIKTIKIIIKGVVQGVGYRKFCKAIADELGIKGNVKNLSDGSVEAYAQGDESVLNDFIKSLKMGPNRAQIQSVEFEDIVDMFFNDFEVL
ncbi:hypothetical protein BKH44_01835 [Helicobacter sp. 13S00477-4]|nr:hypothetical protein BKH44_01835 [Helicobacter sp. 13S00477-4]